MNDKEASFETIECQEMVSLCEQFQIFSEEHESSTDHNREKLSYKNVPKASSSHLVTSINSRIKDYDDRIYKKQQVIKALRNLNEDDKTRMKGIIQNNDNTKEEIRLNAKYCDRIKTIRDRLVKSNLTIEKYLATLKLKVKVKEKDSVKLGGQLKCHLDSMKQQWEADYQKYNSKPQFQQILSLRKSLNELEQIHAFKQQQANSLRIKLQEIEKYKGHGFKSHQEIVVKIAQVKLETLKVEKEIDDSRRQIKNVDTMQIDELEADTIPENHGEADVMEALVSCDDLNTTTVEDDITDINVLAPAIVDNSHEDISMVNMEEAPPLSSQASEKSLSNSETELPPESVTVPASTQAFFTPPNTQTTVSCTYLTPYPCFTPTNKSSATFAASNSHQMPAISRNPATPIFTAAKNQSTSSFSFVPPTPKTPKGQTAMPGFSLEATFLKPTTGFNLGLSNTDSTFSGFQTFSNREIPDATAEKSGQLSHIENGSESAHSYEGSSFLFQPTTPKPQQSTSFFGDTEAQAVPSGSFNFGSFSSTPQETSKYFSNDFLKAQAPQGEVSFAQSIFGEGTQGTVEADANRTVNQSFSFFNF